MDRRYAGTHYTTRLDEDRGEGWISLSLVASNNGNAITVGKLVYWDAEGQFQYEGSATEIPLTILIALIDEAKSSIKTG